MPHLPFDYTAFELVAASEAVIAGSKAAAQESAKLKAQYKLKPEVAAAVTLATEEAKNLANQSETDRSNAKALQVYEIGIDSLTNALNSTSTGPVLGYLPALTENQQMVEGATAAMAPILKDLFRAAGEGTFTKDDQEILLNMLPTRKDKPKAREAKLRNVDAIVRAKLAESPQEGAQQPSQPSASQDADLQKKLRELEELRALQ